MNILIFFGISLFVFIIAICVLGFNVKLKDKVFKINSSGGKFNCVKALTKIIERKLLRQIEISSFISKDKFNQLRLIYAPVYVINAKNIGHTHLKLYKKAFELITKKMNCVILDGEMMINNNNVNVVSFNSDKLSLLDVGILNKLNINRNGLKCTFKENEKYVMLDANESVVSSFNLDYGILKVKDKTNFNFCLPNDAFGYIFKGKRDKTIVYNIFGEKILEFVGNFNALTNNVSINFKVNKPNSIIVRFNYLESVRELLILLTFNIKIAEYNQEIEKLKEKALNELDNNFFLIFKNIKNIEINNLNDFFKVVNLRQNYFNDYVFLIKKIFGITVKNGILNVKPISCIQQDFVVNYRFNQEDFSVNYAIVGDDRVKLTRVGHKLGVKENFVYNF